MRVAVSSPGFSRNEDLLRELGGVGVKVVANQDPVRLDESGLLRFWRETGPDAAIVGLEPVTAEVLDACPHVRLVAKYGVGLDNLDLDATARPRSGVGLEPRGEQALGVRVGPGFLIRPHAQRLRVNA